jgi:ElaB/YqjD/DUF883 family membrane-anchored ribosome-binding protein
MTTHTQDPTETTVAGTQRLADAAGDIAEQATGVAEQRASSTMTRFGDTLEQVARAVRGAGEQLRTDQPQVAGFADTAAEQVESAGQYLRQHDAGEVVEAAQDFARRQPAVVVGAGLALGLLVGRALKSARGSTRRSYGGGSQWSGTTDYGSPAAYGGSSTYRGSGRAGDADLLREGGLSTSQGAGSTASEG